ncbi:hypothetical protein A2970_01175 [Candidatus Roizmanbacteria bacterium RIFCSPLOWO2_01_FULL_44_13]|uniref:Uncharacterized protein n=1 Tax=Candidatus Roizmanbacteria bacterium RIFCSPLOWO2_01_FULL_44_13 TaxID=1802069 RepID=A0A1F7JA14_9BACT|nr:MAG: hypothetical protein A2970_01175 [Candidatus Roizmanbacteria bacterium RIFCSPLOWO2_01_FULL_44_13]
MGSFVEINDTLQLTKEQGFPQELDLEKHLKNPYAAKDFENKVFEFKDKPSVRIYKMPPVRNFLVENREGKWIYWGLVHIIEVRHDYINKTTSGKFKIIYINSPKEMKQAQTLIDIDLENDYFK